MTTATIPKPRVIIVLSGGLVSSVHADCEMDVELLDLDKPEFATEEELAEHKETVIRYLALNDDSRLSIVY